MPPPLFQHHRDRLFVVSSASLIRVKSTEGAEPSDGGPPVLSLNGLADPGLAGVELGSAVDVEAPAAVPQPVHIQENEKG